MIAKLPSQPTQSIQDVRPSDGGFAAKAAKLSEIKPEAMMRNRPPLVVCGNANPLRISRAAPDFQRYV
jgi:hypothetical protein